MKNITLVLIIAASLLFTSCSNKSGDTASSDTNAEVASGFEFQRAFTTLEWTAFKTTAIVPVGGKFEDFSFTPGAASGSLKDIFNGGSLSIKTGSVNSANEERDGKIVKYFFGNMVTSETITGTTKWLSGDDSTGTVEVMLTINNVAHPANCTYTRNGMTLELTTSLDLSNWNGISAVDSLNAVCYDLHKGEDGVSKLWPNVDVKVTSQLRKL